MSKRVVLKGAIDMVVRFPSGKRKVFYLNKVQTVDDEEANYLSKFPEFKVLSQEKKKKQNKQTKQEKSESTVEEDKPKSKNRFVCDICGKAFSTERGLKTHKRVVHSED